MAELMDRKKLIDYLPHFMQNFSELKELMRVANIESDYMYSQIGRLLDEAFIQDCTEYGIRKYENFLHIIPDDGESLETRKLRVLMRWYDYSPYTVRVLVNKMNMICGVNNYDFELDLENYYFKIVTEFGTYGSVDELAYMFESILPMNIFYESVNLLNIETGCSLNYGSGVVFTEFKMLTEDYTQERVIEGNTYVTGTTVFSSKELITNDFKDSATINGKANVAAGIVQAEFFEIDS